VTEMDTLASDGARRIQKRLGDGFVVHDASAIPADKYPGFILFRCRVTKDAATKHFASMVRPGDVSWVWAKDAAVQLRQAMIGTP
jgi:hypothetical protein